MDIKKTDNPDIMDYKETGGCYALIFLVVGAFMFLAGLGGLAKPTGDPMTRRLLVLGPSVFAFGMVVTSWRRTVQFDRKNKVIIRTKGLIKPFVTTESPLGDYNGVKLEKTVRKGPDQNYTIYQTSLTASSTDGTDMILRESPRYEIESKFAAKFAKFLDFELKESV